MQIEQHQRCAHSPCVCQVPIDQDYCSDACREHAQAGEDTCTCGHVDCATEPVGVLA